MLEILKKLDETCDVFLASKSKLAWRYLLSHDYHKAVTEVQVVLDRVWEHLNTGYWKDGKRDLRDSRKGPGSA